MGYTEIMRAIRKRDDDYEEALAALRTRLMSHDEQVYQEMMAQIAQRFREPSVGD